MDWAFLQSNNGSAFLYTFAAQLADGFAIHSYRRVDSAARSR